MGSGSESTIQSGDLVISVLSGDRQWPSMDSGLDLPLRISSNVRWTAPISTFLGFQISSPERIKIQILTISRSGMQQQWIRLVADLLICWRHKPLLSSARSKINLLENSSDLILGNFSYTGVIPDSCSLRKTPSIVTKEGFHIQNSRLNVCLIRHGPMIGRPYNSQYQWGTDYYWPKIWEHIIKLDKINDVPFGSS